MSRFEPGDRVHITGGDRAGQNGTISHAQDSGPGLWIVLDGLANAALVQPELLELSATVASHRAHQGSFCATPWSFPELGISEDRRCTRPSLVVLADANGTESEACNDHWKHALEASDGVIRAARLV